MFFVQMRLLRENDANFERRYSLLDSLATLKMPLLLVETCRADDDRDRDDSPLLELFNTVFEITLCVRVIACQSVLLLCEC